VYSLPLLDWRTLILHPFGSSDKGLELLEDFGPVLNEIDEHFASGKVDKCDEVVFSSESLDLKRSAYVQYNNIERLEMAGRRRAGRVRQSVDLSDSARLAGGAIVALSFLEGESLDSSEGSEASDSVDGRMSEAVVPFRLGFGALDGAESLRGYRDAVAFDAEESVAKGRIESRFAVLDERQRVLC
jgi:hypothetical protein